MTQVRPRVLEKGGAGGRAGEEEAQARQVSGPRGQHPRGRDRSQARGLSGGRTDGQTDRAGGGLTGEQASQSRPVRGPAVEDGPVGESRTWVCSPRHTPAGEDARSNPSRNKEDRGRHAGGTENDRGSQLALAGRGKGDARNFSREIIFQAPHEVDLVLFRRKLDGGL